MSHFSAGTVVPFRVFCRRHYTEAKFLQLMEKLVTVLYPSSCELTDSLCPKLVDVYEMIVSHSAFLPVMLSKTDPEVKGEA